MPTLLREKGYRFYFFSHEGSEPPHVHVDKSGRSGKFWLSPVSLARNLGFPAHELNEIMRIIKQHQAEFEEKWHGYFGPGSR